MKISPVILAAGQGTRMRSKHPKVLHPLLGKAMIWYSLEAAYQATQVPATIVIGHGAEAVKQVSGTETQYVVQERQLGTGHALQQAAPLLKGKTDLVLVIPGDLPLLTGETLRKMVEAQLHHAGPITMLTAISGDPRGFGRVVRDSKGSILAVVEEAQATGEQLIIRELNVGAYCFTADWLWPALSQISLSRKGEYYLTDLVGIASASGLSVQPLELEDASESIGVNTRVHLAEAEAALQQRINRQWMLAGVTLHSPETVTIEPEVTIGADTVIWPNTHLRAGTQIGEDCEIGPNTLIEDTRIGNRCKVFASVLEHAVVEDDVDIGPFGHLRKGAHLAQGVHMGNFGEIKSSYLGPGTKMGHFSYIGDATIGSDVNIGAGTITCNYDGVRKNHTEIGDGVFLGSDTMLVAPVKLEKGVHTGAGTVVTKDLPENSLAVGVPARVIRILTESD
jgi:bifunctional UDP-N-acetylglucosamine pyrophosphorylase/glucosamine-1-phosphate N-acetyltransferase